MNALYYPWEVQFNSENIEKSEAAYTFAHSKALREEISKRIPSQAFFCFLYIMSPLMECTNSGRWQNGADQTKRMVRGEQELQFWGQQIVDRALWRYILRISNTSSS